ncbi:MAG: hypothetical protein ACI8WT_001067 [Clostridium sp.]|jgi:hypothetical protein
MTFSETKFSFGKGSFSPYTSTCFCVHSTMGAVYLILFRIPAFAKNTVPVPHIAANSFLSELSLLINCISSCRTSPYHPPQIIKPSTSSLNIYFRILYHLFQIRPIIYKLDFRLNSV